MDRHDHLRIKLERGSVSSQTPVRLNAVVALLGGLLVECNS